MGVVTGCTQFVVSPKAYSAESMLMPVLFTVLPLAAAWVPLSVQLLEPLARVRSLVSGVMLKEVNPFPVSARS